MNRSRLRKIERELIELSHAPRGKKAGVFIALAQRLGRTRVNRGKEPTYERKIDPVFKFPLTIPNHPGDMKPGTARSIIDALMNDVDEWKEWFDQNEEAQAEQNYDDDDVGDDAGDQE
jgi:hypothetical protein